MFCTCRVLLTFSLISCVIGLKNFDNVDQNKTERTIADLEANINQTLNKFQSNILDKVLSYIDSKVNATNKKLPHLEEKLEYKFTKALNESNNRIIEILNASNKQIQENKETITRTVNLLDSMKKELTQIKHSHEPCKGMVLGKDSPVYSMDSNTFNHITFEKNSEGHLTYFKMYIGIKGKELVTIRLMDKGSNEDSDFQLDLDVGVDSNQDTRVQLNYGTVHTVDTPDILSSEELRTFFINISNGRLEFGKEGGGSPLLSYYDNRFTLVNYFQFLHWNSNEVNISYDCPAAIEGVSS